MLFYDLSSDPNETADVSAQHPDHVVSMRPVLASWKTSTLKSLATDDYGRAAFIDLSPGKNT